MCSKIGHHLPLNTPVSPHHVRFVCVSDTHSAWQPVIAKGGIPPGDVLLHTGDFTLAGNPEEVYEFNKKLGQLPHKWKVVIAGNHEMCFDTTSRSYDEKLAKYAVSDGRHMLNNCIYLEESEVSLFGYKIFGTPYHSMPTYPFREPRGPALLSRWNKIPDDTDILLTHMPPLGHGDYAKNKWGDRWGCVDLLNSIEQRINPKYHVFGHVHQGYGITTNSTTKFVNCSTCDEFYEPVNKPIIFDLPLKDGFPKDYNSIDTKS